MTPRIWTTTLAASLWLVACASSSIPEQLPETSPASLSAPEAKRVRVTRALDEDPPLPGASAEGWHGLQPAGDPASGGHEHHHDGHAEQHGAEHQP